ncbi:MAG: hypothetical protein ABIN67_08465 [Ferruginibacter sp.]
MKHIFSLQLLQRITCCLLLVLLVSAVIFYSLFIWQAVDQLANILRNGLNQSEHYLLSLAN